MISEVNSLKFANVTISRGGSRAAATSKMEWVYQNLTSHEKHITKDFEIT